MSAVPIITLLTDFGVRDPYVGVMKGVMARRCPGATFVDLTHEVPPQDVRAAAFYLRASWSWFPVGTHHLVVVDPGVGTPRGMLLAQCEGHVFVAPDNGLLPLALHGLEGVRYRAVARRDWHGRPISTTFHGRDQFAPALAFLAAGGLVDEVAPADCEPVRLAMGVPLVPPALTEAAACVVEGTVEVVDHFGNLITNLPGAYHRRGTSRLEIAGRTIARVVETFAEAGTDEPVALVGSFGTFEIVVDRGSAARVLGVDAGECVRLHWNPPEPGP